MLYLKMSDTLNKKTLITYSYNFGGVQLNVLPDQENNRVLESRFEAFTRALDILTEAEERQERLISKKMEKDFEFSIIKKAFEKNGTD